ncbi:hypothetical protein GGS21DRAFT_508533 [Xylaria nigripes]|nr:hypothetical protein GGS21DRAFT_508533 [Xylaria nigripes]
MAALMVPDSGLQLESSPSSKNFLPMQAFGIILDDSMIEDMIRCVQSGQDVELTLGSSPSFHYGSREEKVLDATDSIDYELYCTDPADPGNKIQRLPHPTMSIFKKPPASLSTKKTSKVTTKHTSRASSSGADSDADARNNSTQKNAKGNKFPNSGPKGTTKLLPTGRSAMASVLSSTSNRSLPSSPALNGVSSPNPAFSASQQVLEKNKGQRSVLVHELAVRDQTFQHLQVVWTGVDSDLKPTVEKVADFNKTTEKWSLKKIYWKELDVWNYDYGKTEDRQSAIDNAIKVYDRQRVVLSDPVWDRLLPKEDRNKNIVLSKLQATIAKQSTISPAPKTLQKGENGNKSDVDSSKAKSEATSKSNSQSGGSKTKKISEREAQTKRLLSNNPKKPAPKKPTSKVKAAEEKGKRVLSEEFVYDTDTSEEGPPLSQTTTAASKSKLPPKPPVKAVEKVREKPKEPPAPKPALKPKPRPIVRAPRAPIRAPAPAPAPVANKSPQKHSREDDESSSSSGAPLSKRIKQKQPPAKPAAESKITKHRASDASQNSRGTNGTVSSSLTMKSKNTSPTKSSPLATSPPTNASDLDERPSSQRPSNHLHQPPSQQRRKGERDQERERARGQNHSATNGVSTSSSALSFAPSGSTANNKKRKGQEAADESPDTTPTPPTKKPRVSKEIMMQARKFSRYYESYEALHHEIAVLKEPPEEKLADLLDMRERLVIMKRDIQRAVASGA